MPTINKVHIMGNLTRDPELKFTPNQKAVSTVSIALNNVYKDSSGNKKEDVVFVDVEFWGRNAEVLCEYTSKGDPIYVEGRLKLDSWDDKESGQKRTKLKVVADGLQLIKRKDESSSYDKTKKETATHAERSERGKSKTFTDDIGNGDIPF